MFFLLRVGFWLSIVIMLLPTGETRKAPPSAQLSTTEAVSAAGAAVSDLRQFCSRQPDACAVGGQAAVAFGYKAQASAKMLYEFITEQLAPNETGSVAAPAARTKSAATTIETRANETLTPTDLEPAWRGPTPLPRPSPLRRPA
ncbi:MAG: hypothetical protein JWN71_2259 [Xanthobacteraceae bacterium]|jgi:hypothetical protein|nr:hypothetical protein [Xanthobacteraceae bacterium]